MTQPRLLACYFDGGLGRAEMYRDLAVVLERTARKECPAWDIRVERIEPPEYVSAMGNPSHVWNTQKLEWWRDQVRAAADGDRLLLIDGDTAILKPLDSIWERSFDLAFTFRETGLPLNGGVVFVRVSPQSRLFVERWWQINIRLLGNAVAHTPWRAKYAGMNQAALGCLLETVEHGCEIVRLPCREWNSCSPDMYDPRVARILHVKSSLRRAVFGFEKPRTNMPHVIDAWRAL